MDGLEIKTANAQALYESLRGNIAEVSAELTEKHEAARIASEAAAAAQLKRDQAEEEVASLEKKKQELLSFFDDAESQHATRLKKIEDDAKAELAELEEHTEFLSDKRGALLAELDMISGSIDKVHEDVLALIDEVGKLEDNKERLSSEVAALTESVRDTNELLSARQAHLEAINKDIAQAETSLAEIKAAGERAAEAEAGREQNIRDREDALARRERDLATLKARFDDYSMKQFGFRASI